LNTPLITRDYRACNMPLSAEYPAIRFLERNGFSLHYCAGADLATPRAAPLLARSRAYLSVGHDEYWTYAQRAAIEAARDRPRGLHLNFWSANEAYWAVRLERSRYEAADAAEEEPPRTVVCYKETQSVAKLDPQLDEWTGTFRDARAVNPRGAMPENALTGTMFAANAQRHDPLVVDGARFGRHRAWRGTAARAQADEADEAGGAALSPLVLMAGLLGHEWDEDVDNGWRPAGLQRLSETTVDNVQVIQDYGATFDSGTATHALVLHRRPAPSRALVFGTGTVQWSWGLDNQHDVNDPQRTNKYNIRVQGHPQGPSRDVQKLTLNVLADQGVLPSTLAPELETHARHLAASRDERAPTPYDVTGSFDTRARVVRVAGKAADAGGGVVASVEVSWDGAGARWHAATLEALVAEEARWALAWGDEEWHALHGVLPASAEGSDVPILVRVTDDSGNAGTGTAMLRLRHSQREERRASKGRDEL